MPHFGLMKPEDMKEDEAVFFRARLHVRGAKRRLREGKVSLGFVTLYDALISGMQYWVLSPDLKNYVKLKEFDDITDDVNLFQILKRSKVICDTFSLCDFQLLQKLMEEALMKELKLSQIETHLEKFEVLLEYLKILPFNELDLPPEDPNTY
ncbi:hypothetical protein [Candidatus Hodarchaeum mangrovi]